MRIDSSTIGMESTRSYKTSNVTTRRFVITEYQENLAQDSSTLNTAVEDSEAEEQEKSGETTEQQKSNPLLENWENRFGISSGRMKLRSSTDNTISNIREHTVRYIFELLFAARRNRLQDWMEENGYTDTMQSGSNAYGNATMQASKLSVTNRKVLHYTQETWQMEAEDTSFSTQGTVRTSDGREISFQVNVGMSREFEQYYRENLELANFSLCDPLVINLDTNMTEMSDQNFYFDIDADGELDEIAGLGRGSGYLAIDRNDDGVINDGSELFGTANGDGFADLAEYDEDGNGWIDENDAVWSKLQIWCKDENGKDILYRLSDKGVGAICLQRAATDFTLKDEEGKTRGMIRNTGVFLYENGNVGTLQHVDVAKYRKQA